MWRWIQQFDRLLRGDLTALPVLRVNGLDVPILGLAVIIDVLGMSYGACMGLFAVAGSGNGSKMQIAASMLKVPALYLLTLMVTLPSLYVFNALLGSRLTVSSTTRLLVCALAVMLAVLASGGPIVAFFSLCTSSYYFMLLLNVTVFAISGAFGLGFMLQTLHRMTLAQEIAESEAAASATMQEPITATERPADPAGQGGGSAGGDRGYSHGQDRRSARCPASARADIPRPRAGTHLEPPIDAQCLLYLADRLLAGGRADGMGAAAVHRSCRRSLRMVRPEGIQFLPGGVQCHPTSGERRIESPVP